MHISATDSSVLLSVEEMYAADAAAAASGVPSGQQMEAAGGAIAREIVARWPARPVAVLCGPGNNGGDGFVAARQLRDAGWQVRLALLGSVERLKGDAAVSARRWHEAGGAVEAMGPAVLEGAGLVVDALFGAGLARPLEGAAAETVAALAGMDAPPPLVAVDIPSGVHGNSGAVVGGAEAVAPWADLTVTFFRRKPGHLLLPGRLHCGELVTADIGIPEQVLEDIAPTTWENSPALWLGAYPWPRLAGHKYDRGHAVVAGGAEMTGAARLAARAALRVGAGLVTIAAPAAAIPIYATTIGGILTHGLASKPGRAGGPDGFAAFLDDRRKTAVLVGPGNGVIPATRAHVLAALAAGKACVLDADALTVFQEAPAALFKAIGAEATACVLTPHDGEYARIFEATGDRLTRARAAARASGAVVLLKGGDTVVAAPDGRAAININAPAELATAGAGDVLAGLVLGLLAQGMGAFAAACAAVWQHGAAASGIGPGLIADDLADALPPILRRLKGRAERDGLLRPELG